MAAQRQREFGPRSEPIRQANERIARKAVEYRFHSRVPMLCECSDGGCRELVLVGLDDYHRLRRDGDALTVPGHRP
jgi:hypothetical protein